MSGKKGRIRKLAEKVSQYKVQRIIEFIRNAGVSFAACDLIEFGVSGVLSTYGICEELSEDEHRYLLNVLITFCGECEESECVKQAVNYFAGG